MTVRWSVLVQLFDLTLLKLAPGFEYCEPMQQTAFAVASVELSAA